MAELGNRDVADLFRETADLLEQQRGDSYRISAYRQAAHTIDGLQQELGEILATDGVAGLIRIPTIGRSLARSIQEYLFTGHCRTLDRLRGHTAPEDVFQRIPGIGEVLAERIHEELDIETLEQLEGAAWDGKLASVKGMGAARAQAVADHLTCRLNASARRAALDRYSQQRHPAEQESIPTTLLLGVDQEFRELAEKDRLPRVTPSRFNKSAKAWLPVWHLEREGYSMTVTLSNSAQAHRLGKTRDWVIIVVMRNGHEEQFTVVTEYQGDLRGLRVVRGRESACRDIYAKPREGVAQAIHEIADRLESL